jgi:hypothetical protein
VTVSEQAAVAYAAAAGIVVLFQLLLAAGAPLGSYAMGGAFPGTFPPAMRVSALFQAVLAAGTIAIVLSRAGLAFRSWAGASGPLIWVVVVLSAVGLVFNLITPSAGERAVWAPVALVLLVSSACVAGIRVRR